MRCRHPCAVVVLVLASCARAADGPRPAPIPFHLPADAPIAASVAPAPSPAEPAVDARLAFSRTGGVGAWLVVGPLDPGLVSDDVPPRPRLGDPVGERADAQRWRLATTAS